MQRYYSHYHQRQHLLLIPLLLLLPSTLAQLAQPFPAEEPSRYSTLSSTSPLTTIITQEPSLKPSVAALTNLIRTLSAKIDNRIATKDALACNLRAVPWLDLQVNDLQARGFQLGSLDRTCQSSLSGADALARQELPDDFFPIARNTLRDGVEALGKAGHTFVLHDGSSLQWRERHVLRGWDVVKGSQRCTLETATAYRVNRRWYVRGVLTNHPVDAFVPDWQRQYVEEFVREDLGEALRAVHPEYPDGELENGTTILIRQGGKAGFSSVGMGDAENPALVEALRLNELAVDQARDAVTISNIAILALPMVMSLIPVAFVAELNTCATLLYIVFTDIFSALPFLIKGIELFTTGVVNRGEMVAYHIGTTELGVLEVWTAECHGEDSFRNLGISFMVIALMVMAFGIVMEILAWKWVKRKGKSPFGEVIKMGPYTVLERTVDSLEEVLVESGDRRWRIRKKRQRHPGDDMDFIKPE